MTENSDRETVCLLRIEGIEGGFHYAVIVNPSAFFARKKESTNRSSPCPKCWRLFTSENALQNHLESGCKDPESLIRVPHKSIPIKFTDPNNHVLGRYAEDDRSEARTDYRLVDDAHYRGRETGKTELNSKFVRADNKDLRDYESLKTSSYIIDTDMTNLYGFAMSQPQPTCGCKWVPAKNFAKIAAFAKIRGIASFTQR